ncbi:MAG: hypothetical protein AAGM67_12125, partial [Bacteroidota bacterium]
AIFVGSFLYIFHIIPLGQKAGELIYLLYFFDLVMGLILLWQLGVAVRLFVQAQRFGKSHLQLENGLEYLPGDEIHLRFYNKKLSEQGADILISLHHIEESWDVGGSKKGQNKNSSGLITSIHYQEEKYCSIEGEPVSVQFCLPEDAPPSHYQNPHPSYWEIFVESEEQDFFARFFVEVK